MEENNKTQEQASVAPPERERRTSLRHHIAVFGNPRALCLAAMLAAMSMILGKFLLGLFSDIIHIKRTAVIAPLFYAGVFICMALSAGNMTFSKVLIPLYMLGGAVPSVIPFLVTARNFGDKEYGVMSGWMNIAGNLGQIIGPTLAAIIFDVTGTYTLAWIIFAILMGVVAVLYLLSSITSKKKIAALGYTPR